LEVRIRVPRGAELSDAARRALEHAAHHCPVRLSIHDAIEVPVEFDWGGASG
jgi:hypothetical protein